MSLVKEILDVVLKNCLSMKLNEFLKLESTDEVTSTVVNVFQLLDFDNMTNDSFEEFRNSVTQWNENLESLHQFLSMFEMCMIKRRHNVNVGAGGDEIDGVLSDEDVVDGL